MITAKMLNKIQLVELAMHDIYIPKFIYVKHGYTTENTIQQKITPDNVYEKQWKYYNL